MKLLFVFTTLIGCGSVENRDASSSPAYLTNADLPSSISLRLAPTKQPPDTPSLAWEGRLKSGDRFNADDLHQAIHEGVFNADARLTVNELSALCEPCEVLQSNENDSGDYRFKRTLARFPESVQLQDEQGKTLAHWLITTNNLRLMKILLQDANGIKPLALQDSEHHLPIHFLQSIEMAKLVFPVTHPLDWSVPDWKGQTPLHTLAEKGTTESDRALSFVVTKICQRHGGWMTAGITQWLADKFNGNELNFVDDRGRSPLHLAAASNSKFAAEALSRCPSTDMSLIDKQKKTALHYATLHQDFMIGYAILLRTSPPQGQRLSTIPFGINIDAMDVDGNSALRLASLNNNFQAMEILGMFGAK
jgi:ankyrin repeat protein